MNVLLLTVFISVLLAGLFVILFLEDHRVRRLRSIESVSLLPLEDDAPQMTATITTAVKPVSSGHHVGHGHHQHGHDHHHGHKPYPCPNNGKCCGDCKKRKLSTPAKTE